MDTKKLKKLILEHTVRYGLTTLEVLCRLLPSLSENAVRKHLQSLLEEDLLQSFEFSWPRRYYRITAKTARLFGLSKRRAERLRPVGLLRAYSVLVWCNLFPTLRTRLTRNELQARWPWMNSEMLTRPHCLERDAEGTDWLSLVVVDSGRAPASLVRECKKYLEQRHKPSMGAFKRLVESAEGPERYGVVVLYATKEKGDALRTAIGPATGWPVPFRLGHIEALLPFVGAR